MNCNTCFKKITDPVSELLKKCPSCRIKTKMVMMKDKTLNMFDERSQYSYEVCHFNGDQILVIYDKGAYLTVTQDMVNVLADISEKMGMVNFLKIDYIMYLDALKVYDGVKISLRKKTNAGYNAYAIQMDEVKPHHYKIEYYSINEINQYKALCKIVAIAEPKGFNLNTVKA
jgi:hypothetical protein